jgi:hypothetical protein
LPESPPKDVLVLVLFHIEGYMAAENAQIRPGDIVVVWGCGPVARFAIKSSWMLGAGRVIGIDCVSERLQMAAGLIFRMAQVSISGYLIPVIAQECRVEAQSAFPVKTVFVILSQSGFYIFTHLDACFGQALHRLRISHLPSRWFRDRSLFRMLLQFVQT